MFVILLILGSIFRYIEKNWKQAALLTGRGYRVAGGSVGPEFTPVVALDVTGSTNISGNLSVSGTLTMGGTLNISKAQAIAYSMILGY